VEYRRAAAVCVFASTTADADATTQLPLVMMAVATFTLSARPALGFLTTSSSRCAATMTLEV